MQRYHFEMRRHRAATLLQQRARARQTRRDRAARRLQSAFIPKLADWMAQRGEAKAQSARGRRSGAWREAKLRMCTFLTAGSCFQTRHVDVRWVFRALDEGCKRFPLTGSSRALHGTTTGLARPRSPLVRATSA